MLERRLDEALEEEKQRREAYEAEQNRLREEEEQRVQQLARLEEEKGTTADAQSEAWSGDEDGNVESGEVQISSEEETNASREPVEASEVGQVSGEVDEQELSVDFVGDEDDDDNVWQQVDVREAKAIEVGETQATGDAEEVGGRSD